MFLKLTIKGLETLLTENQSRRVLDGNVVNTSWKNVVIWKASLILVGSKLKAAEELVEMADHLFGESSRTSSEVLERILGRKSTTT